MSASNGNGASLICPQHEKKKVKLYLLYLLDYLPKTFAHNETQLLLSMFLIYGEKHSTPSVTQSDFRAELLFLRQYYGYYLKKALIILYEVKRFSFLAYCPHKLTCAVIYCKFYYKAVVCNNMPCGKDHIWFLAPQRVLPPPRERNQSV